jgi:hypothetical protein
MKVRNSVLLFLFSNRPTLTAQCRLTFKHHNLSLLYATSTYTLPTACMWVRRHLPRLEYSVHCVPVLATYARWPTKHQQKLDQHRSPINFLGSRLLNRNTKSPPWGMLPPHACTLIRYNVVT